MNELIKIEKSNVGGDLIETVNARELHQFLEVGRDFSTWIKGRIEQYGFIGDVDYVVFPALGEGVSDSPIRGNQSSGRGGDRRSIEYHISLDMAKELAMVENNDQGRKARRYFIECERRLKQPATPVMLSPVESDLRGVAFIADSMRLPESGKLDMFTRYCQANAPRILPALPAYAIDKPSDSTIDSSQPTVPISKIVDGITSAKRANLALHAAGLLEQRFRETSNGGQKAFWSVTEKGTKYGKNLVSPSNSRETQPHWYVKKANEIIDIIKANL